MSILTVPACQARLLRPAKPGSCESILRTEPTSSSALATKIAKYTKRQEGLKIDIRHPGSGVKVGDVPQL